MKNTFILILIAMLFNSIHLEAQNKLNYKITYNLKFQPDSTDANSATSEEMWLFANKDSSLFLSRGNALQDSLSKTIDVNSLNSESLKRRAQATKTEFDYRIFKDKKENKVGYGIKIMQDRLYYAQALNQMKWEIKTDTKEILGYQAQKATTSFAGRDYIAWFTAEIPLADGPYKFAGLPGLILELQDTNGDYVFSFKGFEELDNPLEYEVIPKNYKEVSKKDLLELVEVYERDPISYVNNYVGEGGKTITIGLEGKQKEDYLKKHRAELAKKNNPIELNAP